MEIISKKRANGRLYAYSAGRFWVWNEELPAWKESPLMAQKYALNHEADKLLTPAGFLTDPAVFTQQNVTELPPDIVEALCHAQPCQNAPIEPVKETAVAPAVTQEDKPTVPDNAPAFDYTGLDAQPATLLYEAAKPSAPEEMVRKVTLGEITSSAEYRALLKENHQLHTDSVNALNRANAAEAREEEAWKMVSKAQGEAKAAQENLDHEISQNDALHEEKDRLLRECEAAKKARADAEDKASAAEGQLEAATADVQGLAKENAKLHAEKEQAENRARKAEDALKHQPIAGVVDEEEIDCRAHQQAYSIAADMTEELKAEKAQLQKELDTLCKSSAQTERRMKAMTSQMDDLGQTDFDTANYFAGAALSLWNSCKGSYSRLTGKYLESTFQYICNALNDIREEAARLCRQPEGYEGGTEA